MYASLSDAARRRAATSRRLVQCRAVPQVCCIILAVLTTACAPIAVITFMVMEQVRSTCEQCDSVSRYCDKEMKALLECKEKSCKHLVEALMRCKVRSCHKSAWFFDNILSRIKHLVRRRSYRDVVAEQSVDFSITLCGASVSWQFDSDRRVMINFISRPVGTEQAPVVWW